MKRTINHPCGHEQTYTVDMRRATASIEVAKLDRMQHEPCYNCQRAVRLAKIDRMSGDRAKHIIRTLVNHRNIKEAIDEVDV